MPPGFDGGHDFLIGVGLQVLERQSSNSLRTFPIPRRWRWARRSRRSRGRCAPAARAEKAERAHVVETVGQLDQNHADVFHHGRSILRTLSAGAPRGEEIELGELGDAIHAARHLFAEFLANLLDGDAGILDHVVQQTGLDGDRIHAHVGEDESDGGRVDHVGLAGVARLPSCHWRAKRKALSRADRSSLGRYSRTRASRSPRSRSTASSVAHEEAKDCRVIRGAPGPIVSEAEL